MNFNLFRSPGSRASPRVHKHQIPEGPIQDFTTIIENTVPEDWQKRTAALQTLVAAIPSEIDFSSSPTSSDKDDGSNNETWYNSPPILRHLAIPLSELLKDLRSTVVKRTCESCQELFSKCRVEARYLLKDIMPTILQVHASTVHVIRTYVQGMVLDVIPNVPCKMAMPLLLDRLKHDKSRTVREACCIYLSKAIEEWSSLLDEAYLTRDIYMQVGTAFIKALRDASPQVRQIAKKGLEILFAIQPDVFDTLLSTSGEVKKDIRTKKVLLKIKAGEAVGDDISVASRVSIASAPVRGFRSSAGKSSTTGGATSRNYAIPNTGRRRAWGGPPPPVPTSRTARNIGDVASPIPTTIGVSTTPNNGAKSSGSGLLGPPRRVATAGSNPPTSSAPFSHVMPDTPLPPKFSSNENKVSPMSPKDNNKSFDTTETDVSELQPITSTTELREVAKSRGMSSRRSSLLQDRLMRSASNLSSNAEANVNGDVKLNINATSDIDVNINGNNSFNSVVDVAHLGVDEIINHPNVPEHTKIAHQLLEAHKLHVDQVMEVLKVEMDALKDFELILLEEGPRRPTEEEVLEYFESLGLCLEQRTKAGHILQKKMDRISKGK